jgi:hypothetical protein
VARQVVEARDDAYRDAARVDEPNLGPADVVGQGLHRRPGLDGETTEVGLVGGAEGDPGEA